MPPRCRPCPEAILDAMRWGKSGPAPFKGPWVAGIKDPFPVVR
jgi:hypothetical protein